MASPVAKPRLLGNHLTKVDTGVIFKDQGENGTFLFADCGLNQDPTPEELAAIADTSSRSFKSLIGPKPVIAMLSHSTKGSAKHAGAKKQRAGKPAFARAVFFYKAAQKTGRKP